MQRRTFILMNHFPSYSFFFLCYILILTRRQFKCFPSHKWKRKKHFSTEINTEKLASNQQAVKWKQFVRFPTFFKRLATWSTAVDYGAWASRRGAWRRKMTAGWIKSIDWHSSPADSLSHENIKSDHLMVRLVEKNSFFVSIREVSSHKCVAVWTDCFPIVWLIQLYTHTRAHTHTHTHTHTLNKFTDTLWVIVCLYRLSLVSQIHETNISYLLKLHVSVYWSVILLPLLYYKFDIWTSIFSFFLLFFCPFIFFFSILWCTHLKNKRNVALGL